MTDKFWEGEMDFNFTRGPWGYWEPETEAGKWQIDTAGGPMIPRRKIATVHTKQPGSEGNARLIAAAPDLYAALREIEVHRDCPESIAMICAEALRRFA